MDYELINLEEYVQTGEGGTALSYNHKDGKTLAKLFTPGMGAETAEREFLVNKTIYEMGLPTPWDSAMRSLIVAVYELGVTEIMVVAHTTCGACHMSFHHFEEEMLKRGIPASELHRSDVDLNDWLEGFHDTENSVRNTVATIVNHPLIPSDVVVRGFIIDSVTGKLTEVK